MYISICAKNTEKKAIYNVFGFATQARDLVRFAG